MEWKSNASWRDEPNLATIFDCKGLDVKLTIHKYHGCGNNLGEQDHIHLLIECSPQHYIPNIIKLLKGISSRLLMQEYNTTIKKKLWGGHLWSPSYFVATVSENAEEQIKYYIKNQKLK